MRLSWGRPVRSGFLEAVVETLTEVNENSPPGVGYSWWTQPRPWPPRQDPQPKGDPNHWTDLI